MPDDAQRSTSGDHPRGPSALAAEAGAAGRRDRGGCGAAALILAAWGLQWMRFTPESILLFRVAIGVLFVGLAYALLVRPLMRRVTDEQVALYLEEHEPSLDAVIISAIENGGSGSGLGQQSPALASQA